MNPRNNLTGNQWETCAICGLLFPIGQLVVQKGRLVCASDVDDLERERRELVIERILTAGGAEQEGADRRNVDQAFFGSETEVQN